MIRPRHSTWLHLVNMTGAIYQISERKLMSTNFDDFAEGLQNKIFEETRAAYGDVAFQR
jgi:hypothetical protein